MDMRIKYTGKDNRVRISDVNRFKFIPDGFQSSDPRGERDEDIHGPLIIFHTYRIKGGKRTVLKVPADFNFEAAEKLLLENGWIDLSMYPAATEFYY